jgi:hypothetical protein
LSLGGILHITMFVTLCEAFLGDPTPLCPVEVHLSLSHGVETIVGGPRGHPAYPEQFVRVVLPVAASDFHQGVAPRVIPSVEL